jgi:hypothetical protein
MGRTYGSVSFARSVERRHGDCYVDSHHFYCSEAPCVVVEYPPQTPRFSQRLQSTARCQRLDSTCGTSAPSAVGRVVPVAVRAASDAGVPLAGDGPGRGTASFPGCLRACNAPTASLSTYDRSPPRRHARDGPVTSLMTEHGPRIDRGRVKPFRHAAAAPRIMTRRFRHEST